MSEYQYYEFHALDYPLSHEAQQEMRRLSSRVRLTATTASFVYNYGDLRGDPFTVLAKHFDAMLYITNWGTRQLMFRFPAKSIPNDVVSAYKYANSIEWLTIDKYIILNLELEAEEEEWGDGEGTLSSIIQIRSDILHGDWRGLYLAWLKAAYSELEMGNENTDEIEPFIPPNLQDLSPTLRNFIAFIDLNKDLLTAAAQASSSTEQVSEQLEKIMDRLSDVEKHYFLERLLKGEPHLDVALANRLRQLTGTGKMQPREGHRTIRQLLATSNEIRQQRLEAKRRQTEADHATKMEKIARQQDAMWVQIFSLIDQKKAVAYDEAVSILKDLRDLAVYKQQMPQFQDKLATIQNLYPTLSGLHRRLKEINLI